MYMYMYLLPTGTSLFKAFIRCIHFIMEGGNFTQLIRIELSLIGAELRTTDIGFVMCDLVTL